MKKNMLGLVGLITGGIAGAAVSGVVCTKTSNKIITQNSKKVDKFRVYYEVLNQWLALKQEGKGIAVYLSEKGYRTIAIYGMGELGNRLKSELDKTDISIKYCLDKESVCLDEHQNVIDFDAKLPSVDLIIVTAMFAFDEIEEELSDRTDSRIMPLDELIFSI
ncbi:MAG: hypothetical protein PHE02_11440 [Lachnospiraceae bacterium]|nr:hypothetical protein [Lachnospiraceae bacterium]